MHFQKDLGEFSPAKSKKNPKCAILKALRPRQKLAFFGPMSEGQTRITAGEGLYRKHKEGKCREYALCSFCLQFFCSFLCLFLFFSLVSHPHFCAFLQCFSCKKLHTSDFTQIFFEFAVFFLFFIFFQTFCSFVQVLPVLCRFACHKGHPGPMSTHAQNTRTPGRFGRDGNFFLIS